MSLSNNFPAIKPSLMLDFANTGSLDPRVSFARASTGTYYDGVTTAKAEENLLLRSQEFDNVAWAKSNTTVTSDTIAAPDETPTADTITDNATSASHSAFQNVASIITVGTTYTLSCYLKAGTSNYGYLSLQDAATPQRYFAADFDLSGGTVRTSAAGTSGTLTSATITSVGSGWYRCVVIGQVAAVGTTRFLVGVSDGTTAITSYGTIGYVGSGSTIYAWGAQLEQRSAVSSYTVTTTQPIVNYIPVLQTAAANVARFDHNPTTGEALGLLIEEQRSNALTYSEDFANAAWSVTGGTIQSNVFVAPNGTLTGDIYVPNVGSTTEFLRASSITLTADKDFTISGFFKGFGAVNGVQLYSTASGNGFAIYANFLTETATASVVGTGTLRSFGIYSVGDGWYRVWVSGRLATGATAGQWRAVARKDSATFTGDGYSGLGIWGAQMEQSSVDISFPTSYIATTSAQVTRSADAASMTGTNFSSWYRADEGTLYGEWVKNGISSFQAIAIISDNTSSNLIALGHGSISGSNNNLRFDVSVNNTTQASLTVIAGSVVGTSYKTVGVYKVNDFAGVANAGTVQTDTSGSIPIVDKLSIGSGASGASGFLNGTIKKIAYYPSRLTNAQLQALTS